MRNRQFINLCKAAIAGTVILLAAFNASAASITYGFFKLTNNNVEDLSGQLSITMMDASTANATFGVGTIAADQLLFTVENDVDAGFASNVAEVYFDDGLAGPSMPLNSLGGFTNFIGGSANPSNLPGANNVTPSFQATMDFSADVNPGPPVNGVNTSADILGIVLGLGSFADFGAAAIAVAAGDLRFGLHVRSIGVAGDSDSYIGGGPDPDIRIVPIPAAAWLFGSALLGLVAVTRRKNVV